MGARKRRKPAAAKGRKAGAAARAAPPRVVVAKPGLDGHDRGAKVVARALRDAGMEVIYTGLKVTPEQVVQTALDEDADAIGLSILSGAHMHLVPRTLELLKEAGARDIPLFVGGIIPTEDAVRLKKLGVAGVYGPGTSTETIVADVRRIVGRA
ncbi:MAG TPA: cobalamin B12-binding domain-containing protein [Candidatus Thermoplasmatota archaeon]|nr:cobalamin B12-binding domain-containing protein [Candidatus Thermoplasmatota archaeon]